MGAIRPGSKLQIDGKDYVIDRELDGDEWQLEEVVTRRIHTYSVSQLLLLIEERRLNFHRAFPLSGSSAATVAFDIPEPLREEAAIRRMYVKEVDGLSCTSPLFKEAIERLWRRKGVPQQCPHWGTVQRWRNRYQQADEQLVALVTQKHKKGNRKARYSEASEALMWKAIEEVYLTRQQRTIAQTLEEARYLVMQENKLRPSVDQLPLPSKKAIKRRILEIPAFDRAVARKGRDSARNTFRTVKGHFVVERPLARAEIDHTLLDIVVTDDEGLVLGRPYMTICVDVFSRAILGLHIGFNPPSFLTVASCLKHAVLPKATLQQQYPDIRTPWFAYGVMDVISVDNGQEFHSDSFEQACFAMNIDIDYGPRKTGYSKPIVERIIGHINQGLIHSMPGTTFSNHFQKGDYNPVKNATVRLGKLRQIVCHWICDVYHKELHRTLRMTPHAAWVENISPKEIIYPDNSLELDAVLGWRLKRMLTHKGIEYMGLLYNSAELANLRCQLGAKIEVEVRVNQDNIGSLYVLSPVTGQPIVVPALRRDYADGMCLYQHKVCRENASRVLGGTEAEQLMEAKHRIYEYIEEERKAHRKAIKTRAKQARFQSAEPSSSKSSGVPDADTNSEEKISRGFVDELLDMEQPEILAAQYRVRNGAQSSGVER